MDLSTLVNSIGSIACILSVQRLPNNGIGEIRIEEANKKYRESMPKFRPGMIYSELIRKERKFEHFVASAALKSRQIHTYVHSKAIGKWMDQVYIPLESDREDVGYCIFAYELTDEVDPDRLGNVTLDTATSVIKSCALFRTADSFKVAVNAVVEELIEKCSADAVTVVSLDELTHRLKFIAGASVDADDVQHEINVERIPPEVVKSWGETIAQSNALIITDEDDMKLLQQRNPGWAESMKAAGISSICFVPLIHNKSTIGYLYVMNFDTGRTIEVKELLEHTSFFLAAELASNTLMEKMRIMSSMDSLTGVYNRNAMNMRVDEFVTDAELRNNPYGLIFIDLNGLKYTNDKYGHEAGDQMLWSAANILRSIFGDYEIYRAGGDEFTIICTEISEEQFLDKIGQLREKTTYPAEVTMSLGYHFSTDGEDIRNSMKVADFAMYKDKEEFYTVHPELKSRKI